MPTVVAIALTSALMLWLFVLDTRRGLRTSPALWIPAVYVFLTASRPVSMWLGIRTGARASEILEGSPIDRPVYIALQLAALVVLATRWPRVRRALQSNAVLLVFIAYCLASVMWSEFPGTALKRWVKLVGELLLILVVATEERPTDALKRFFAWQAYAIVPLSVLFIKYIPNMGRIWDPWSGAQQFCGVSYNKNMLGIASLLAGLGLVWTLVVEYGTVRKQGLYHLAIGGLLLGDLWLLKLSESTAAQSCFLMGVVVIGLCHFRYVPARAAVIQVATASMLGVSAFVVFFGHSALELLGEDSTLTGRTELWSMVFRMTGNPVIGAGYESFWLGRRLETIWKAFWWAPNQAHNGYIEIYINLGWIGIVLLALFLVGTYYRTLGAVRQGSVAASLLLSFVVVAIPFNYSEAAFRIGNLPWLLLLLAAVGVGTIQERKRSNSAPRELSSQNKGFGELEPAVAARRSSHWVELAARDEDAALQVEREIP